MDTFRKILTHYLTLALERAGVKLDSDCRSEFQAMFEELDAHIEKRIAAGIEAHEGRYEHERYYD